MSNSSRAGIGGPEAEPAPTSFVGNRVRLQRLRDAKFFSGWVVAIAGESVQIRLNGDPQIEPGETFAAEAHGTTSVARFTAGLNELTDQMGEFKLTSSIRYGQGTEQARYLVGGVTCVIYVDGRELAAEVIDYSGGGLGIRLLRPLTPGADVEVMICSGKLSVLVDGQIRHCRLDPEAPGRYRAGILLEPRDSEQAYAWDTFRERLKANAIAA